MPLVLHAVVVDANDPQRLARFWSEALGYALHAEDPSWTWVTDPSGQHARMSFQRTAEPKQGSNRLHLDLKTADAEVESQRLLGLGATVKRTFEEPWEKVVVMQDPEGNEFCVFEPRTPST